LIDGYRPGEAPPRKPHMEIPKIGIRPAITNIDERLEEDSSYRNTTSRGNKESYMIKETNVTDLKIQVIVGDKSNTGGQGQKISISEKETPFRLERTPNGMNMGVRMSTGVQYPICMSEVVSKNESTPKVDASGRFSIEFGHKRETFLVRESASKLDTSDLLRESPHKDMRGISTVKISEFSERAKKSKVTKNRVGADSVINKLGIES
jgi:hypothetical protein